MLAVMERTYRYLLVKPSHCNATGETVVMTFFIQST